MLFDKTFPIAVKIARPIEVLVTVHPIPIRDVLMLTDMVLNLGFMPDFEVLADTVQLVFRVSDATADIALAIGGLSKTDCDLGIQVIRLIEVPVDIEIVVASLIITGDVKLSITNTFEIETDQQQEITDYFYTDGDIRLLIQGSIENVLSDNRERIGVVVRRESHLIEH